MVTMSSHVHMSCMPAAPTIADVISCLGAKPELNPCRKRELCSALRTVCRALTSEPSSVPADPRFLRKRLESISAAHLGVGPARWNNVRSLTLKALKLAGIKSMPGRAREPLAPAWEMLRTRLPDRHFKHGLSHFMSYCTAHNLAPETVDRDTFRQFGADLESHSLHRDPGGLYRDTCKLWNKAASTIPDWPALQVPVPDRRRTFALPLDCFPTSFQEDVCQSLASRAEPDVFSEAYCKPARPLTLRTRKQNILMAASALVRSGCPIERITSLAVLVAFDNAKAALRILLKHKGGKTTGHLHHIATTLKTIARHHVCVDEPALEELRR